MRSRSRSTSLRRSCIARSSALIRAGAGLARQGPRLRRVLELFHQVAGKFADGEASSGLGPAAEAIPPPTGTVLRRPCAVSGDGAAPRPAMLRACGRVVRITYEHPTHDSAVGAPHTMHRTVPTPTSDLAAAVRGCDPDGEVQPCRPERRVQINHQGCFLSDRAIPASIDSSTQSPRVAGRSKDGHFEFRGSATRVRSGTYRMQPDGSAKTRAATGRSEGADFEFGGSATRIRTWNLPG
jgi:hypothetical protein